MLEIWRQFRFKMHEFARPRMDEAKFSRMKGLAAEIGQRGLSRRRQVLFLGLVAGAIGGIAEQRMAEMGHVDADLVGPSGFKAAG